MSNESGQVDEQGTQAYMRQIDKNKQYSLIGGMGGGADSDSEAAEEVNFEKLLDMEDKKILNKRKKRIAKVEECNIDIEAFIN